MDKYIALYLRVSTREQAEEGFGLISQEDKCREYVKLYEYKEEIKIYKDDGYSAKNMKRPALKRLIEDVKKGIISTIVCYKLDRLSRAVVDIYHLLDVFSKYDCQFVAVADRIDLSSPNGRLICGILSIISEFECSLISSRTIAGISAKCLTGRYPFSSRNKLIGWNRDDDDFLTVNEKEAELINQAIDMYIDGLNFSEICRFFSENGVMCKNWRTAKKVLSREWNVGLMTYRGKVYDNIFPPIISEEKYKTISKIVAERRKGDSDTDKYLFHSKVHCVRCKTVCGCSSTIKTVNTNKRKYYYYVCPECKRRVNQNELLKQSAVGITMKMTSKEMKEESIKIQAKLDNVGKKMNEVLESYENNKIDHDTYIFTIRTFITKKNKLENELKKASSLNLQSFFFLNEEEKKELISNNIRYLDYDFELGTVTNIYYKKK